ncbi:MAG: SRPBCC domain-containing protein [Ferruginibacter sp.]
MSDITWGSFVVRININATAEKLYPLWSTEAGMESWFLRSCEYKRATRTDRDSDEPVQKGDTYVWRWHGYNDDVKEEGVILDCNSKDYFKFSFGRAGDCIVTIKEEAGQTIVQLYQENIPDDERGKMVWHVGCKAGWSFYLANLKSFCEGGIDLRNKDERLTNMLNS